MTANQEKKCKVICLICNYQETFSSKTMPVEEMISLLKAMSLPCGHQGLSKVEEIR